MKGYLLHGDNVPESRKKLSELVFQAKEKGYEVLRFSGGLLEEGKILEAGRTQGLLVEKRAILIENLLASGKGAKKLLEKLAKQETFLILWEGKQLSKPTLTQLKVQFKVLEFKIPTRIFSFLEAIQPGNSKLALKLLSSLPDKDSEGFVFLMLTRHVRLLIWVKEDHETLRIPEWQKRKLASQAKKFSRDELRRLHTKLLDIDRASKKSEVPGDLGSSLELLLAQL